MGAGGAVAAACEGGVEGRAAGGGQSVRTADTVPIATKGFDAGKKVKGRKRFLLTDALGLLLAVHVLAANVQDRDGAKHPLLKRWAIGRTLPWSTAPRRLARDYETNPAHSESMIRWAMTGVMVRRLTRGRPAARPGPLVRLPS